MDTAEPKQLVSVGPKEHEQSAIRLGDKVHLRRGRIHEVTGASADMFAVLQEAHRARIRAGARHPREQVKKLFYSRDFH